MLPRLGVNVDHVATIRQQRGTHYPDPVMAAQLAELGGADGIIVHLREDRRHIQERDLRILRETIKTRLNLEMAATSEMLEIATSVRPDVSTLVPERREELTTEGGLDVYSLSDQLKGIISGLKETGIAVSLFIDPDTDQIKASHRLGADIVEIHTGRYADAQGEAQRLKELQRIVDAVKFGNKIGIMISAGHGLNYHNIKEIASIEGIEEFNIGHSIVSRAVMVGMTKAVQDMLTLIRDARSKA